jgi:polygalacturonase
MRFFPVKWLAIGVVSMALSASAVPTLPTINTANVFNITSYGANTGNADNAGNIQNAITAAAAASGGGTVEIPPGIFLSGPLTMKGKVNLQIDAGAILRMLPYDQYPGGITNPPNFIYANKVNDIEISGSGAIDGQGAPWWPGYKTNSRPIMIRFSGCNRQLVQDVTLSNSPMFHLSFSGSKGNITVQGVTIRAPASGGHNTDACDVSGTNILVQNCDISVGDDDFTCGGGTSDVLITNNTYGSGHGISIGSYTQGVSNIMVINCTINGADNGIRIKSDNDRSGIVQNISYYNIGMTNVHFPIQIYGYYNETGTPSSITPAVAAGQPVAAVVSTTPVFRNITFSNINATSVSGYPIGIIWARTELPATNIVFKKVNVTGDRSFDLYNVSGAQFIDCNLKPSSANPTFQLFNAQAVITNSATANTLFTFDGLTTNGYDSSLSFYNAAGSLKNTNAFNDGPLTLSASMFTVSNNLAMFPTTVLNFVAGTNAATLAVTGNLTLGGTVNVTAGPGFAAGTYTLMTYGGTLNGTLPVLASVPAGYDCVLDTNTPGKVRLIVKPISSAPPPAPLHVQAMTTNGQVILNWSPAATATSYHVKRAITSGGSYTTNATVTTTNYTDTQVTSGTTYYYVVSAVNAAGESTNSVEVSAAPQTPTFIVVTTNVFQDTFSSSTLNSSSPAAPTPTGTSYQIVSSKSWNPTPSLGAGHLKFGIGATSSGSIEVQALFANPVTLTTVGDQLLLTITFTNTAGLLTASSALGFGLYQSGQNFPVPGGLNSTATTGSSANASGNAQTWMGYVGQVGFTGASSQIMTRPAQISEPLYNNDQDLVTSGSGSSSYNSPTPATVGSASSAAAVTLNTGDPYT